MSKEKNELEVIHQAEKSRFIIQLDEQIAELDYRLNNDVISFTHTGVPKALEGRGIGGHIVRAGLEYAREQDYAVIPICPFVSAYIRRHPEYSDLLKR